MLNRQAEAHEYEIEIDGRLVVIDQKHGVVRLFDADGMETGSQPIQVAAGSGEGSFFEGALPGVEDWTEDDDW